LWKNKNALLFSLSLFIIFLSFIYLVISFDLWDYDFWWHIATGKYIVETGKIPDKDPFSYTEEIKENQNLFPERKDFLLKQYWLAQVIFYLIYDYAGPKGIILLRAFLLTIIIFLVFFRLKKWDVNSYITFIFIFFLCRNLFRYIGERPVLFTILFTVLIFLLLESFREKKGKSIFLLPPLMLLWSNLHGGFILGNIIMIIYMLGEGTKILFKKVQYSPKEIAVFYIATVLALFFSYINPTGWYAFAVALSPEYKFFEAGIQEYTSPIEMYLNKQGPIDFGYATLALLFPIILLFRNKKLDLNHVLLLSGFFVMSLKTGRYAAFYVPLASMVLGKETGILIDGVFKKLSEKTLKIVVSLFSILAVVSSILFLIGVFNFKAIQFDVAKGFTVPESAVDFVAENRIQGNIFHDAGYGGYITWRLYPWKKTFIDTRWLNYTVKKEYAWIMNVVDSIHTTEFTANKRPLWKRLLDHYNINLILFIPIDIYGTVPRLILALADDNEWVPIYCDSISIVFIKNIPENYATIANFKIDKETVYNMVIFRASIMAGRDNQNPKSLLTLGKTFYSMGKLNEALIAYKYALKRSPQNEYIKKSIEDIQAELTRKEQ